ncbi:hypothetical protein ANOM_002459 [Aspergillus nomiae NRRL 13137]|uniref:Major facilitator superfamily (MFS) profile domain-containing protein n=1 Tax=Aspergillus nomiae NRRL (strain ATCC 15546 / NRRL 13137 / CBS 260.88 / M93) TaxID=1509407 RepID=A0A0L1JBP1_ASPN3|nr:uncharacterized protein ANOM_002459 [Aspergillus nomiae NRRL 13137]KNG88843.1 hypothetical protein ANOM_002459 [Aspergillus nomiae NRRL 13137]
MSTDDLPQESPRQVSGYKWFFVCVGFYLTTFLYGLDTTIAADVQGPIIETFGQIEKISWVGIAFPMGSVATILLMSSAYGSFDIKWLYICSIVLFEIGSAICGAAPTMDTLIGGRIVAGIGGAGMYLGCMTYIAILTSPKERPIYNALVGPCWGTGCILGPILGGAFSIGKATWRWAFYINLILAAITAPIYILWFPRFNPQSTVSTKTKLRNIDWLGALLNASTFTTLTAVIYFAGGTWKWQSGATIALWVVAGVSLFAYMIQQTFSIFTTEQHRLFPVHFVKQRTMVLLYLGTAAAATSLFVPVYYIPILFQFTRGDSAMSAAVRLLPFITVNVTFAMLSGGTLMYFVTSSTTTAAIYGFEVLIAIGAGLTQQMGYSIACIKVKPQDVAAAVGFVNVAQLGSITIALAISGSVFQNVGFRRLQEALQEYSFSEADIRSALAGTQSSSPLIQSDANVVDLTVGAISHTIGSVFGLIIAAGALALVSSFCMKREKLSLTTMPAS